MILWEGSFFLEELEQIVASHLLPLSRSSFCCYLHGNLGSGKTTLARAWLEALGWKGFVPSPTFTYMNVYTLPLGRICHMDLYRVPEGEIFFLEEDYYGLIIEWPENKAPLPASHGIWLQEGKTAGERFLRLEAVSLPPSLGKGNAAGV